MDGCERTGMGVRVQVSILTWHQVMLIANSIKDNKPVSNPKCLQYGNMAVHCEATLHLAFSLSLASTISQAFSYGIVQPTPRN